MEIKKEQVEKLNIVVDKISNNIEKLETITSSSFDKNVTIAILYELKEVLFDILFKTREQNIFDEAKGIITNRDQERERNYGPIETSMNRAAVMFNELSSTQINTEDAFKFMIALKLSRLSHSYKRDTYLDLIAYTGALNDYLKENSNE